MDFRHRRLTNTSIVFYLLLLSVASPVELVSEMLLEEMLIDQMNNISYKKTVRPSDNVDLTYEANPYNPISSTDEDHQQTKVKVKIMFDKIEGLRETENDLVLTVTLVESWRDSRLALNRSFSFLSITYFMDTLWKPDLYFYNIKEVMTRTHSHKLVWLYPNGDIVHSERMRLKLYCSVNLWRFPLDTQHCILQLGSNGYPIEDMALYWWHNLSQKTKNVIFNQQFIGEFDHPDYRISINNSFQSITGTFSVLQIDLVFKRNCIYHIFFTFLPASLIVFVSWMSFYIDHKSVPARIPFCLLTLLTIMTQWSNINRTLPKLSYLKAIDLWMFICMIFIIGTLFEYAFVNGIAVRIENAKSNKLPQEIQRVVKSELVDFARTVSEDYQLPTKKRTFSIAKFPRKFSIRSRDVEANNDENGGMLFSPTDIDKISRYLFPFLFAGVNIIFWVSLTFYD